MSSASATSYSMSNSADVQEKSSQLICVKNTFIEVCESKAQKHPRRADSAPPSTSGRSSSSSGQSTSDGDSEFSDYASTFNSMVNADHSLDATPPSSIGPYAFHMEDQATPPPSTGPYAYHLEEMATPLPSPGQYCFQLGDQAVFPPAGGQYTYQVEDQVALPFAATPYMFPMEEQAWVPVPQMLPSVVGSIAIPTSPPGSPLRQRPDCWQTHVDQEVKTALNTKAPVWQPDLARARNLEKNLCQPAEASKAWDYFSEVINAGRVCLASCPHVQGLQCVQENGGYLLLGTCQKRHFEEVHAVYLKSMSRILDAAADSSNVYVIGYDAKPWTPSKSAHLRYGMGVSATLAVVSDESTSCWDLLGQGTCAYGSACRWNHPTCQASVEIVINFTEEDVPR